MRSTVFKYCLLTLITATYLSGCGSSQHNRYQLRQDRAPSTDIDISQIPDAVPRIEPRSQHGNPKTYQVRGKTYRVIPESRGYQQRGVASWYGAKFHGHRTSSGETYNMYAMTAAHTTLPLPTYVRVTHLENGRSVIVKVNDRGPFHDNRLIDLSYAAAKKLGITARGTGVVEVTAIDPRTYNKPVPSAKAVKIAKQDNQTDNTPLQYALYLQAGAFISRNNAEQLQHKLKDIVNLQQVHASFSPDKQVYRVRIGPLSTVEEADRLAQTISERGLGEPHIVID